MRHLLLLALFCVPAQADQVIGEIVSGIYVRGEMSTGTVAVLGEPPTGLVGWWDPDVPSTVHTSGGTVTALDNLAGGNHNLSQFVNTPTFQADAVNGNDGIAFTELTTDCLYSDTAALTAPPICVMAASSHANRDNSGVFSLCTAGSANNRFTLVMRANGTNTWETRTTTTSSASGAEIPINTTDVLYGEEAATDSRRTQRDGANEGTASTSKVPSAPNRTAYGAVSETGTNCFKGGYMGPAVLWNVVESASKTRVERWLGARWGVSVP